jgi:hypothetical protein
MFWGKLTFLTVLAAAVVSLAETPDAEDIQHVKGAWRAAVWHHRRPNNGNGYYAALAKKEINPATADTLSKMEMDPVTGAAKHPAATQPAVPQKRAPEGGHVPGLDISVLDGWLYVTGDLPVAGTDAVVAQADGCRFVINCYHNNENPPYERVFFLEGGAGSALKVWAGTSNWNTTAPAVSLAVGEYITVFVKLQQNPDQTTTFGFDHFDPGGKQAILLAQQPVQDDYNSLMQTIDNARYVNDGP